MTPEEAWACFEPAFRAAVAAVGEEHFQVKRHEADDAYRERAYCYELYHQLRWQLPTSCADFPYVLHGEVDKRGHEAITRLLDQYRLPDDTKARNPDYIVHKPGSMDDGANLVVIEVKPAGAKHDVLKRDLHKLHAFVATLGYYHGIMLVFGQEVDGWPPPDLVSPEGVRVLWHKEVGHEPQHIAGEEDDA